MVIVSAVATRDVAIEVHAPVDLRPLEQADVGSKVLGYIDAVLVDRGDHVRRGQLLALVRPSDLPDQLAAARGTVAQIESSLALARANRDRARLLAPTGVMSQQELQQAEAAVASAEATQVATQAQLGALGVRLGETRIESPLDGVVALRRLDPGALVGPPGGGAILNIVRMDRLRVFVTANERDAMRLSVGQEAHVELDGLPGQRFVGKVVRIAPTFDLGTRTLEAEVQLDNPGGLLRPGMYGYGSIVLETHVNAPVLPVSAVQITTNDKYVFVLEHDKVVRRSVELGVDGGSWLEVLSGVRPGEDVVTAGADGLSDGTKVRVTRDVSPYTGVKATATASAAATGSRPQ
jgi:membrane fusion protein, multidrug efflux system